MFVFFAFLAFLTVVVTFVGILSPKRLKLENNLKNRGKILLGGIVTIILLAILSPMQHKKSREELEAERIELEAKVERQKIALKKEQELERAREQKEKKLKEQREKLEKILEKEKYGNFSPLTPQWNGNALTLGLVTDGSRADGYAERLCEVAKEHGYGDDVLSYVILINAGKMVQRGEYIKIGEAFCK